MGPISRNSKVTSPNRLLTLYRSSFLFMRHMPPPSSGSKTNFTQPQKSSVSVMSKLGTKFVQFQKSAGSSASQPGLKKWGTRAAIGLGALGAIALGVDAMDGGILDGAAADAGTGIDAGTGVDVGNSSSAVDASFAQLAMEQQGQENALMLLDSPGTEYTLVNNPGLI